MTPPPDNRPSPQPRTSRLAIASFVLAIWIPGVFLILFGLSPWLSLHAAETLGPGLAAGALVSFPAAFILGIAARRAIRRRPGELTGRRLTSISLCASSLIVSLAFCVYPRVRALLIEDAIHHAYFPVVVALDAYDRDHLGPARDLSQVVPQYMPTLPRSPYADAIEYSIINHGKAWQLCIHSQTLSPPRIYCYRSTHQFTEEEKNRVLTVYHGWTVLQK